MPNVHGDLVKHQEKNPPFFKDLNEMQFESVQACLDHRDLEGPAAPTWKKIINLAADNKNLPNDVRDLYKIDALTDPSCISMVKATKHIDELASNLKAIIFSMG